MLCCGTELALPVPPGRQHQLEEQLLFSGRFSEALRALLDWLCHVEPQLSQDTPVSGHRDLVADLMDKHKVSAPPPVPPTETAGGWVGPVPPTVPRCSRRNWASGRAACGH